MSRANNRQDQQAVIDALRGGPKTHKQLFDITGQANYRARITELRRMGYDIETNRATPTTIYILHGFNKPQEVPGRQATLFGDGMAPEQG